MRRGGSGVDGGQEAGVLVGSLDLTTRATVKGGGGVEGG